MNNLASLRLECFLKHVSVLHNIACRKIPDKSPAFNINFRSLALLLAFVSCIFIHKLLCARLTLHIAKAKSQKHEHMQNICFRPSKTFYSSLKTNVKINKTFCIFSPFVWHCLRALVFFEHFKTCLK